MEACKVADSNKLGAGGNEQEQESKLTNDKTRFGRHASSPRRRLPIGDGSSGPAVRRFIARFILSALCLLYVSSKWPRPCPLLRRLLVALRHVRLTHTHCLGHSPSREWLLRVEESSAAEKTSKNLSSCKVFRCFLSDGRVVLLVLVSENPR